MKRALLYMIKGYQNYISPMNAPCCRYTPTCSRYAFIAIERFGVLKGVALAFWRILRCNPFSKGGYDPVPETLGSNKRLKVRKCHAR
ncbi:MAG: membrane protein insertion efficiency factor YidD [Clostridia bacterium]